MNLVIFIIVILVGISIGIYFLSKPTKKLDIIPRVWTKTHSLDKIGGSGGGNQFSQLCNDSYVTGFDLSSGQYVNNIGIKCSDGTSFDRQGGNDAENLSTFRNDDGYNSIDIYGSIYVNKLGHGKETSEGLDDAKFTLKCSNDEKIVGIYGESGAWLDSLGVHCGKQI